MVTENPDLGGPATVEIPAAQLHVADVVRQDGGLHAVTSLRLQGAPPEVSVEFAGLAGRRHFRPTAPVSVLPRRR